MKNKAGILLTAALSALLVFTASCTAATTDKEITGEGEAADTGTIELLVTDPPPADVKSAIVQLSKIEVHIAPGNSTESDNTGWVTLLEEPASFDLLEVIGVEQTLGSVTVQAGKYTQIRMDVTEVSGNTTDDEPYTATVPGDKLKIVRSFTVEAGETTALTLDFDGEKSLIRTGNGKYMFKPVVKLFVNHEGKQEQEQEQEQEGQQSEFEGIIEEITGDNWTVNINGDNRTVDVSGAEITGEPEVGKTAEIKGTVENDIIIATEVEIKESQEGEPEEPDFEGIIEEITGDNWTVNINGDNWTVDVSGADITGEPEVGKAAEIMGEVDNGIIIATEVEIKEPD